MPQRIRHSLRLGNRSANLAMLTLGQACLGAGRCHSRVNDLGVTQSVNRLLCNKNLATRRAMLTLGQARRCTSRCLRRINHLSVTRGGYRYIRLRNRMCFILKAYTASITLIMCDIAIRITICGLCFLECHVTMRAHILAATVTISVHCNRIRVPKLNLQLGLAYSTDLRSRTGCFLTGSMPKCFAIGCTTCFTGLGSIAICICPVVPKRRAIGCTTFSTGLGSIAICIYPVVPKRRSLGCTTGSACLGCVTICIRPTMSKRRSLGCSACSAHLWIGTSCVFPCMVSGSRIGILFSVAILTS